MAEAKANYTPSPDEIAYRRDWQTAFQRVEWENWLIDSIMLEDSPELTYAVALVNQHGFTVARRILIGIVR